MLTIRLQRAGKKNKADFRIVLAEKTAASQKKFLEVLGAYNPHTKAIQIRNQDRLNYWVDEQHVDISATARNLLITKELIKGDKTKAFTIPKKEVVAEENPTEETATEGAPSEAQSETPVEAVAEQSAEAPAEESVEESKPAEVVVDNAEETKSPESMAETPEAPEIKDVPEISEEAETQQA